VDNPSDTVPVDNPSNTVPVDNTSDSVPALGIKMLTVSGQIKLLAVDIFSFFFL